MFTMMLLISFYAVTTACVLLYLELKMYGDKEWWNTAGSDPQVVPTAPAPSRPTSFNSVDAGHSNWA